MKSEVKAPAKTTAHVTPQIRPQMTPQIPNWKCQVGAAEVAAGAAAPAGDAGGGNGSTDVVATDLVSELRGLTVGQNFHLVCQGDSVAFQIPNLKIETVGAEPKTAHFYQLQLMKVNSATDSRIDMTVASFQTGA